MALTKEKTIKPKGVVFAVKPKGVVFAVKPKVHKTS